MPQWENNNIPTYFLEGEAAVRRILEAKKQEVQSDLTRSMDYAQMAEKSAEDRKRIREEKQRQARQQAVQVSGYGVSLKCAWLFCLCGLPFVTNTTHRDPSQTQEIVGKR